MSSVLPMYSLTVLTGREAAEKRTVVIGTVELNWRLWIVLICSAPAALLVAAFGWLFLGQYAIILVPAVMLLAAWLFYMRSNEGMRLRVYQSLWDKTRSKSVGNFYMCNRRIDTSPWILRRQVTGTVRYAPDTARQTAPLVETQPFKVARRGDGHGDSRTAGAPTRRSRRAGASAGSRGTAQDRRTEHAAANPWGDPADARGATHAR